MSAVAKGHQPDTPGQQDLLAADPIIRQRERTIDNVKRLYAIIFSLSVTNFVREIFETAKDNQLHGLPVMNAILIQTVMLLVFFFTAAVFFFQTDRFLDIRYAMLIPSSWTEDAKYIRMTAWTPFRFAFDYISLVFTMLPFMVMSFAMDPVVVSRYGIIPFALSYIVLLQVSCAFLIPYSVGRLRREVRSGDIIPRSETARYAVLSNHWIILNSVTVLILEERLWSWNKNGALCQMAFTPKTGLFIACFAVIAVLRNLIDFRSVWPFLYLSSWVITPQDRFGLLWLTVRRNLSVRNPWMEFVSIVLFVLAAYQTITEFYWPVRAFLGRCTP